VGAVQNTFQMIDELKCPSCGVPYDAHLGLIGTCAELQRLRAALDDLAKRILQRRDEKADYPETEFGKAQGLDEALEIITAFRTNLQ
jgi:hypothetical protein